MAHVDQCEATLAALVIVDVQDKMLGAIDGQAVATMIDRIRRLVGVARILEIPILLTEQYPKGLGPTHPEVLAALPDDVRAMEKSMCSCWRDEGFSAALQRTQREHVILVGVETHVCIQQTALDLRKVDYVPFVAADAVASRRPEDRAVALDRMRAAGVTVSTCESLIFELVERCDHPKFKQALEFVK